MHFIVDIIDSFEKMYLSAKKLKRQIAN